MSGDVHHSLRRLGQMLELRRDQKLTSAAVVLNKEAEFTAENVVTDRLSSATPNPVGSASAGSGTTVSRADHVHAHGNQSGGTLHSEATTSVAGFLSATDKTAIDRAGLARTLYNTPSDDFDSFSGWSWSTDGGYDGAPSSVSVATYPSHVVFMNDSTSEDHFCYLAGSVTTRVIRARLFKGMQSYIGLRLSNSDESAYIEIRLEDSAAATGLLRLARYQNGVADAALVDHITPGYIIVELGATSTGGFWYSAFTTNTPLTVVAGSGGWATTITRWGITFGQRGYASDGGRSCGADWFTITS